MVKNYLENINKLNIYDIIEDRLCLWLKKKKIPNRTWFKICAPEYKQLEWK